MTDAKELERVAYFHEQLDYAASIVPARDGQLGYWQYRIICPNTGKAFDYSAAEIRAWPEVKVKLISLLTDGKYAWANYNVSWFSAQEGRCWRTDQKDALSSHGYPEAIARGLCLYRELLTPSEPAKGWHSEVGSYSGAVYWHGPGCETERDKMHFLEAQQPCSCGLTLEQAQERGYIPRAPSSAQPESPAVKEPQPTWDHEIYTGKMGGGTWPDLDTRIAAARAEMDRPLPKRSKFDGGPWQVWPKGDERNEP